MVHISIIDYYIAEHSFIYKPIKTITVRENPRGIATNENTNRIYVSNEGNNTISVIDGNTNKLVKTIPVGANPYNLVVNPNTNMIYVANYGNGNGNTVSVIDGNTNKLVKTIPVGYSPMAIAINPDTKMIYVTNIDHNKIYIINGTTNNVTAGVSFEINSGYLDCNPGGKISNNSYITYDLYTVVKCKANPNSGFVFSSWSGMPNKTDTTKPGDIQFNVTRYGTLTANFMPAGPTVALPKEFYDLLSAIVIGVILGPIVGWLIPFLVDRSEKERQT